MGSVIFLKLAGIPGDSTNADHKAEIELASWGWVSNRSTTYASGGSMGQGALQADYTNISCSKALDIASRSLQQYASTGQHISEATLTTNDPRVNWRLPSP